MKIQMAAASIPGTRHTMPGSPFWKNNQDGYATMSSSEYSIGVVCDGCSGGAHSEIGAVIASQILVRRISWYAELGVRPSGIPWRLIKTYLTERLRDLVWEFPAADGLMADYFLFTIIGFIITPQEVCIFHVGDGVFAINDTVVEIGPFADNSPPYLMYAITGSSVTDGHPELLDFQICIHSSALVDTVLVGSDGVEDLIAFESKESGPEGRGLERLLDTRMLEHPDRLRRHLAIINKERVVDGRITTGPLRDDTTLIIARITHT